MSMRLRTRLPAASVAAAPRAAGEARRPAVSRIAPPAGHDLARLSIEPQAPAAPPVSAPIQPLFAGLKKRVKQSSLYKRGAAIAAHPNFKKMRAVMGVLGLAGGYRQGHGEHGAEARGAYRERWEKYFAGIPDKKKRAAAMKKFTLPDKDEEEEEEEKAPPERPQRGASGDLGDIEMTDLSSRGGGGGGGGDRGSQCPTGGGQAEHPPNRFDEDSGGGGCSGVVAHPRNRLGSE